MTERIVSKGPLELSVELREKLKAEPHNLLTPEKRQKLHKFVEEAQKARILADSELRFTPLP